MRINDWIRSPQIRLIGAKGEQIGIVDVREGIRLAREEGLDLVEVAPQAKPPVCRILDFSKFLYALSKKEKEARKKHKIINVKEIKLTSKIDEHDYQTKLAHARRFLERGDKVKLTLMFRGREITHMDLGEKVVQHFIADLTDWGAVERNDGLEGKALHLYIAPKVNKKGGTSKSTETKHAENKDK
ncbi:MAG: translation initiation factor IF-3 [Candidatus Omnitrophica bacterium]|nr:translation initiation factor IF-3 [Candidatus Omnitrophota bacterium]